MTAPVIVIGAGGHAKVLIETLQLSSIDIIGIVDEDVATLGRIILGVPVVGDDDTVLSYPPETVLLVNGIGSIASTILRWRIFDVFKGRGYGFASTIHPSAILASDTELAEGVQIMAGAVIQPGCSIGADSVVNTRASIDHDCKIGNHVHIAPGVTLSGGVSVGDGTHIGTGATVIQGITVGSSCTIGAGSVVVRDVADGVTVVGVPAKVVAR